MTAPTSTPTRADLARDALFWTAVADEAKARADAARAELADQARHEYQQTGAAPTWRIPGIGTVPLYLTNDQVAVVDEAAYVAHVADRHPGEVETIRRVRPAFDEALRKRLLADRAQPMPPGLELRVGGAPRGVAIRAGADAKAVAAETAVRFLNATGGE